MPRRRYLEVPEVGADEVGEAADLHRHQLPHLSRRLTGTAWRSNQLLSPPPEKKKVEKRLARAVTISDSGLVGGRGCGSGLISGNGPWAVGRGRLFTSLWTSLYSRLIASTPLRHQPPSKFSRCVKKSKFTRSVSRHACDLF